MKRERFQTALKELKENTAINIPLAGISLNDESTRELVGALRSNQSLKSLSFLGE